jgi:hypothetical protein
MPNNGRNVYGSKIGVVEWISEEVIHMSEVNPMALSEALVSIFALEMVEVMNTIMLTIDYVWYGGFNHHHTGLWKKSDQDMIMMSATLAAR